jgi:hypothetical protein
MGPCFRRDDDSGHAACCFAPSWRGALATKPSSFLDVAAWIASQSLSSGAHSRDPSARDDGERVLAVLVRTVDKSASTRADLRW